MKKAFIKRALVVMTAGVLAANLVACGTKKTESDNQVSSKQVTKPTTITAMFDTIIVPENGQADLLAKYKEMTGIELKVTQPAHNQYYEKVNLAFASGEVPDIVEVSGSTMENYAMNGALYDMTDLVKNSSVLSKIDKKFTDAVKVNGKLYAFPISRGNGPITYMRQDWLDRLNLKAPTTYDEYINVLKQFVANPPSNMKKGDVIGFTAPGLVSTDPTTTDNYVREFYQDAVPNFQLKNGKWVEGMDQPEMKKALQRMKDAYSAGLIDKEVFTNTTSQCRDKWNAGKVGAFTYWAGTWATTLETQLKKTVPDEKMVALPAIKETKYLERVPTTMAITSKSKNPEGVFKYFLEFAHDGGQGTLLFTRGVEGVNYSKDSSGTYKMLPAKSDPKTTSPTAYFGFGLNIEPSYKDPIGLDAFQTKSMDQFNKDSKMSTLFPESDTYNKYATDLLNARTKVINDIVYGKVSIDDGIKKYDTENKANVDTILKEFNTKASSK